MVKKHIHTYERRPKIKGATSSIVVFKCIDPDCSHREVRENLFGKRANCPFCGESFVLDPRILRNKLPHCGCKKLSEGHLEAIRDFAETDIYANILKLKQDKFNREQSVPDIVSNAISDGTDRLVKDLEEQESERTGN